MKCDFCQSAALESVYEVPESVLGMSVKLCRDCGLVQSVPSQSRPAGERLVSTSSGANWGNIRHGKGLRLPAATALLTRLVPWDSITDVLDVGSNRGDFVRWLHAAHPGIRIVGVEPDGAIVDAYRTIPNLTLHVDRFERLSFPADKFGLVYCSHTLEHADSAAGMLRQIRACLGLDGYLFLEVPNIDVLQRTDTVEEFFIDKHRFHFNRALLCAYLKHLGFRVVHGEDADDRFNITLLLKKGPQPVETPFAGSGADSAEPYRALIAGYRTTLAGNRARLAQVAQTIGWFMKRQKVAFWGAGRLLDALVRYGGLDLKPSWGIVDEYLCKVLPAVHEMPVRRPEHLKLNPPDVVIVLARSSADEITAKARSFGIRKVIPFSDLLQSAASAGN